MKNYFNQEIEKAVHAIVANVHPQKIYLFGSVAEGRENGGSDLDLCIIVPLKGMRKIDMMRQIRRVLSDAVQVPLDLLVYEDDEFTQRATFPATIEHKIAQEGSVLYEH